MKFLNVFKQNMQVDLWALLGLQPKSFIMPISVCFIWILLPKKLVSFSTDHENIMENLNFMLDWFELETKKKKGLKAVFGFYISQIILCRFCFALS